MTLSITSPPFFGQTFGFTKAHVLALALGWLFHKSFADVQGAQAGAMEWMEQWA